MIDHSLLRPNLTTKDILGGCQEAREYEFIAVCVNPTHVELVAKALAGSGVRVCSVVSFPFGLSTTEAKVHEAKIALSQGASEIDMVINQSAMHSDQPLAVQDDIRGVVEATKAFRKDALVKVILENCYLTDKEKIKACELAVAAGADFVKTSTGYGSGGATVKDIRLMRKTVGPDIGIKAAGGIRTLEQTIELIKAGATRIGTSSSTSIIQNIKQN